MLSSTTTSLARFESDLFSGLNSVVTPNLRAGFGTPGPCANGIVLLETTGRKSGRIINVPLVAVSFGNVVVVSTVRARRSAMGSQRRCDRDVRHGRAAARGRRGRSSSAMARRSRRARRCYRCMCALASMLHPSRSLTMSRS